MVIWTTRHLGPAGDFADEAAEGTDADWRPPLDIYETPTEFYLVLCVPGVGADHLDVTTLGRTLTIAGRRVTELPEHVRVMYLESPRGHFLRRLRLPNTCDMEAIATRLADGQLVVRIPKRTAAVTHVPVTDPAR